MAGPDPTPDPTLDQAAADAELDRYAAELADQARAAYGAGRVLR